jgi:hypothetical protein
MHRSTHFAIAIALITSVTSVFWSYRVRAADEAAQFMPAIDKRVVLPAATAIDAVIRNRIASSAVAGETVVAFVSIPVVFNGKVVIPYGARLEGNLQEISVFGAMAKADISFAVLTAGVRSFAIQTRPIVVFTPVQSDTQTVGAAVKALTGIWLGIAIGAASGNGRLIEQGLLEGARIGLPEESTVPITVILIRDLET